ncbi:MAG: response regulator [Oscillospiraceae bacterium]|nr:response regulator [Oscillospiraceae bacterium]
MFNKQIKIIYVDDVAFQLVSVQERLKGRYEVIPAKSVANMFEILETPVIPDLILLDINMPDIDGFEAVERLNEDPIYGSIPVIFISSSFDKNNVNRGLGLGVVDFIRKPFSDADLFDCIEYQLNPLKRAEIKPIVLAVDDDPGTLKAINFLLKDRYLTYTLNESIKLKQLLTMITPDLFLLDCIMPDLCGFDLVAIIREHAAHKETPIVFMTADGTADNMFTAVSYGASDFIIKPIEEAILSEKLALHLKHFIIRRRLRSIK